MLGVRTLAEMRTLDTSYGEAGVFLAGRDVSGDGAGGVFALADLASPVDDDGIEITDAAGRTWRRQFDGAIDPRWYGLRQTAADNRPAIERALAAALGDGVGEVRLPRGVYAYSGTINVRGQILAGSGSLFATRLLRAAGPGNGIDIRGVAPETAAAAKVCDLHIDTDGGDSDIAINIAAESASAPSGTIVERVRISHRSAGTWANGIYASGAQRTDVDGIRALYLRDVEIFACRSWGGVIHHCHQVDVDNVRMFAAGSRAYSYGSAMVWPGLWIGATAARLNSGIDIRSSQADGPLVVSNTSNYTEAQSSWAGGRFVGPNVYPRA